MLLQASWHARHTSFYLCSRSENHWVTIPKGEADDEGSFRHNRYLLWNEKYFFIVNLPHKQKQRLHFDTLMVPYLVLSKLALASITSRNSCTQMAWLYLKVTKSTTKHCQSLLVRMSNCFIFLFSPENDSGLINKSCQEETECATISLLEAETSSSQGWLLGNWSVFRTWTASCLQFSLVPVSLISSANRLLGYCSGINLLSGWNIFLCFILFV